MRLYQKVMISLTKQLMLLSILCFFVPQTSTASTKVMLPAVSFYTMQSVNSDNTLPLPQDDFATTEEDISIVLNVLENDIDPDGDLLTLVFVSSENGISTINPDNSVLYKPNDNYFGTEIISYRVSDGKGGVVNAMATITVNAINDPPVAANDAAVLVHLGSTIIDVLSNDSDVELSELNIISATSQYGQLEIDNNKLHYTSVGNYVGSDVIEYTIMDDFGTHSSAFVEVTIHSIPAIIGQTDLTILEDHPLSLTINSLTISDQDDSEFTLHIGEGSNYEVIDSQIVPDIDYNGTLSIPVTVSDGIYNSEIFHVAVDIQAVNDPPKNPARDLWFRIAPNTSHVFNFYSLFNDPEAMKDPSLYEYFTYEFLAADRVTVINDGITPNGSLQPSVVTSSSQYVKFYTYTPNPGFTGIDVVHFFAIDNEGARSQIGYVLFDMSGFTEASWEETKAMVGKPTLLQNANTSATKCISEENTNVYALVSNGVATFFGASDEALSLWKCFDGEDNLIHQFTSSIIVERMKPPSNFRRID